MMAGGELVTIGGTDWPGWYDPAENAVYFEPGVPVAAGSVITVRGAPRRAITVELWNEGGLVAHVEELAEFLPDTCELGSWTKGPLDPDTGTRPDVFVPIGAPVSCLVEVEASSSATDPAVGDWTTELVLYTVKVPLSVTAAEQGTAVKVTASADPRLLNRTLHVIRVLAESRAKVRILLCAERQL